MRASGGDGGRFGIELPAGVRQHQVVKRKFFFLLLALLTGGMVPSASAQGTAFLYQGRLTDGGSPANGAYDLRFALYDAMTNGNAISSPQTNLAVAVSSGVFTQLLDFGPVFTGTNYWLAIGVRTNGSTNAFVILSPRQSLTPVPYALFATTASNLISGLPASQLIGPLPASAFVGYTNVVALTNAGNQFNGTFAGNGLGLTNLNGSAIASGTVADKRLSTNVALLNTNQIFTGANTFTGANYFSGTNTFSGTGNYTGVNTFTNWNNTFTGNFFGNGLVGWTNVPGSSVQASRDAGYMLTSASLTTVTLPLSANLQAGDIVRISGAGSGGWLVTENPGQSIIGNFTSYHNSYLVAASLPLVLDWRCLAASADGTRMYAGNNGNYVYTSTDAGHTWNTTSGNSGSSSSVRYAIACSADGTKVFAASYNGYIQMSSDGGATWTTISGSGPKYWTAIASTADGSKFFAAASGDAVYLWSGGSPSVFISGAVNWSAVACSSDGAVYAAAYANNIMTTGGNTTASGNCSALVVSANGLKIAAAYNGGITTSANSGASWTPAAAPAVAWSCLAGSSDCTRLVGGANNGLFYASANFGATWTALSTTNQYWSGVDISADGSKFAATVNTASGITGNIFYSSVSAKPNLVTTNPICGSQGAAVELQYIGSNQFMPVSSVGSIWAN